MNLLLDIYEKQGSDNKFRVLCEKELKYSYLRYVQYLETRGEIDDAIKHGNKSSIYANGFYSTELHIKLGDLESKSGNNARALDHYVSAFDSDPSGHIDPDLLEKIKRISLTVGNWQTFKDILLRSLERGEYYDQMVELF